ncbi:peptide deformylase [Candidatus Roizmanbacteria bacterium]|nr:peptide deformylase [Candidatus Roizmanbacteria bacterium]
MLKIVTVPNDILTTPTKLINSFDGKLHQLVKGMEETLNAQVDPQGVGLAAAQVGVGLSLFIIKPTPKAKITTFVNPVIIKAVFKKDSLSRRVSSKRKKHHFEGCLSIPKIWSPVKRATKFLLEYQTINGVKKTEWFSGFEAVIIQHEVDHLNGILFTQRALEQKSQLYEEQNGKLQKFKID